MMPLRKQSLCGALLLPPIPSACAPRANAVATSDRVIDVTKTEMGGGTVDGQSPALKKKQKPYKMRPFLLRWVRCTNVAVKDVHLINPGAWTLNFYQTESAVIDGVTIRSRDLGMLINGVPGHPVEAISLENIHLGLPGGGTEEAAKIQLPEKESAYPEFGMFGKTIPASGIYARHVRGIKLQNMRISLLKPDARPATVFIDVEDITPANFATESAGSK